MKLVLKAVNSLVKRTRVVRELREDIEFLKAQIRQADQPVELAGGVLMHLPDLADDALQRDIFRARNFTARAELAVADRYLPEGAVILDIGANIGNHALYWAFHRKARRVVCFEPAPANHALLRRNIAANGFGDRIEAHQIALGAEDGSARVAHFTARNSGAAVMAADPNGGLRLARLDTLAADLALDHVDLIKIDVEGFEAAVLQGARMFLARHRPVIFIEIFEANHAEVSRVLQSLGYREAERTGIWDYVFVPGSAPNLG
ncbi:MAG: FkbM family methyltransferase [Pannonibacter sp.]